MANKAEFIKKVLPYAEKAYIKYGWLPSVTIAQAALESGWGESGLTEKANNLFGIKAKRGEGINLPTKEYIGGQQVTIEAWFRAYESWAESFDDRSQMLFNAKVDKNNYRYRHLCTVTDPKQLADGLRKAGYATDPNYGSLIMGIVNQFNLTQYDYVAPTVDPAFAWAKDKGFVDGTRPKDNVTREELAMILQRFAKYLE